MFAGRLLLLMALVAALASTSGCQFVSPTKLSAAESRLQTLSEQNRALLAEIENRKQHVATMEDRVRRAEEDLALLEEELGLDRRRLGSTELERDELRRRVGGNAVSASGVNARLADLAARHPALNYDPATGAAKFDADLLFDSGEATLRPEAQDVLAAFAAIFQDTSARDLKIMVVGHTDDRNVAKRPTREQFGGNWELSTARALAVANYLRQSGVPEDRMGVTGFASHQPIAANQTPDDRLQNRRVEIFVMGPETPIVGWSDASGGRLR